MLNWGPIQYLVSKVMLPFLTFSYEHLLPNYGVSIILLTVLIKLAFVPLMSKQYKSIKAMQDMQPELQRVREQYKDEPQQLQQELVKLYKLHKVNPLSGCLPMLVQIPFFIAIYATIVSPEFKAILLQPGTFPGLFPFWLGNLSIADPTYVLPVLVSVLTFWTQKQVMTDPTQQKLLWLSPLLILAFGISLPSGVLLYWAVSTLLSGVHQVWMMKQPSASIEIIHPR